MNVGFIRFLRLPIVADIVWDQKALALLVAIANRARFRDGPNLHDLKVGEALVGDYKNMGLTHKEYRGAIRRLEHKWKQITTKRTNHGTIAKLTESAVFDVSEPKQGKSRAEEGPSKGQADSIGENAKNGKRNAQQTAGQRQLTNNDIRKQGNNDDTKTRANSLAGDLVSKSSSFDGPYQNHIKWPEFAQWCAKKNGKPTAEGFTTWLIGQKPEWRNKVKEGVEENGYELDGKFYLQEEANRLAASQPSLIVRFRPARRRNGRVHLQ